MKTRRTVTVSGKENFIANSGTMAFVSHEKSTFEINQKAVMTQHLTVWSALTEVTDFYAD